MKQFSGGESSSRQVAIDTSPISSGNEPMFVDVPETYLSAEELAQRLGYKGSLLVQAARATSSLSTYSKCN